MERYSITPTMLEAFQQALTLEERSRTTVCKYMHGLRVFFAALPPDGTITKEMLIARKEDLTQTCAVGTVNGMLTALNRFLTFHGLYNLRVKYLRRQRRIFADKARELSREEYLRLVRTADRRGKQRLMLVLQTICSTGVRVSELEHITVQAVSCGRAEVRCKGKTRVVFLPKKLQALLLRYIKEQRRTEGPVFVTRSGRPLDRSNIWHEMKALCRGAGVAEEKVFPHNLRHLFARVFYGMEKDIAKLADLLGHSSIETTRIYIMESGEEHLARMEKMHLLL